MYITYISCKIYDCSIICEENLPTHRDNKISHIINKRSRSFFFCLLPPAVLRTNSSIFPERHRVTLSVRYESKFYCLVYALSDVRITFHTVAVCERIPSTRYACLSLSHKHACSHVYIYTFSAFRPGSFIDRERGSY